MTLEQAKQEFAIRYYLWAGSEWKRGIAESFPDFHSFKTGTVWDTHQFMKRISKNEQGILATALLKRFHKDAAKWLGEDCSVEEELLRTRRDDYSRMRGLWQGMKMREQNKHTAQAKEVFRIFAADVAKFLTETSLGDDRELQSRLDDYFASGPPSYEEELERRKRAGEKIQFVSKGKLLKAVAASFQKEFDKQCVESVRETTHDPHLTYEMKCNGWILATHFWFGRKTSLINYNHSIYSDAEYEQQGKNGKFMGRLMLDRGMSFTSWLGLTWE